MSTHLQNLQIMQQLKTPLAKKLAPAAFDLGEFFKKDMEKVNWEYSPEARPDKAAKLRRKVLRDLRDNIRKPIDERRAETAAMRAKATMPALDKSDDAKAARREARDRSYVMTSGERRALMSGPNRDTDFIDAVRERPPWMSGIREPDELQIWEITEQERSRELNAPLLDAVAARDIEDEEALMVYNKVRNDIVADSGLERNVFEAEAKVIESKAAAPWLKRSTDSEGREVLYVFDPKDYAHPRIATEDEARDGVEYPNLAAYLAARAA